MIDPTRGVFDAGGLPRFTRVLPAGAVADLVAWFWIPEWDLPDGVRSEQRVLGYPAGNLVVEGDDVSLWGATTRLTTRELRGSGWAVGALLQPAAFAAIGPAPHDVVDGNVTLDEPALAAAVGAAMRTGHAAAVEVVGSWLVSRVGEPIPAARLANDMMRVLTTDSSVLRVEDAAAALAVSPRTLQRLAHRTVGLPPVAIIRRRRLQEAAQQIRERPALRLAEIAASLGYADQSHLANDFRTVLGFSPSDHRASAAREGSQHSPR